MTVESPSADRRGSRAPAQPGGEFAGLAGCLLLLFTASIPIGQLFTTGEWVRPVWGGLLVAVGLAWGARQLRARAAAAAVASAGAWALFVTLVFAPATTVYGIVPTMDTVTAIRSLFELGWELFLIRSAPVAPQAAFLLLAVTGTWIIGVGTAHATLYRGAGLRAVATSLLMFAFPLPLSTAPGRATAAVALFLAAGALVLLVTGSPAVRSTPDHRGDRVRTVPLLAACVVATLAIGTGVAFGDALPGADEPPVYDIRGRGGTTTTTNPMVTLKPSLIDEDRGPVLHVTTPRPVYLRTTALDTYDEQERWTTDRIRGSAIEDGVLPPEVERPADNGEVTVDVEVAALRGVLVPVPYPAFEIGGPVAEAFQYDASNGTVTVAGNAELGPGDTYTASASLPPGAERLEDIEGYAPDSTLTALPDDVPADVHTLAGDIVEAADATTPFAQALAIQDELQTWTYSLEPEQGHSGQALQTFLDTRTGYCEQFAATMAVMLRTLDVPARVAVGFTPGELADPDEGTWEVSSRNAHAWVEVLFPGHGWIAFEPTPRSDGNVLVPSAANLAPSDTLAADQAAGEEMPDEPAEDPADADPDLPDEDPIDGPEVADEEDTALGAGAGRGRGWVTVGAVAGALGVAVVLTAGLLLARRPGAASGARARVLEARRRAEHIGRGLGLHPRASDTDAEYLSRLGARVGSEEAAGVLAVESARARYAVAVDDAGAVRAEEAAARLRNTFSGPLVRAGITARGAAARWLHALKRRPS